MHLLLANTILAASSSLFESSLPQDARLKQLAPYFDPSFNEIVTVDKHGLRERKHQGKHYLLKGHITVKPPKGFCFTVRVDLNRSDYQVCEAKKIPFRLGDINGHGEINWTVSTGPQDFGTKVTWKTPYRVGRVVDQSMSWPGPSRDIIIKSCKAVKSGNENRELVLSFFYQGDWKIRIPKQDILVAQPKSPQPNLYVQKSESSSSFTKIADAKAKKELKERTGTVLPEPDSDENPNTIETNWQMHPRNSYSLQVNNVFLGADNPQGAPGRCQYRINGYENDPSSGALECHDTGPYHWIYIPISCIKDIFNQE